MSEATIFNPFPDGEPQSSLQVLSAEGRRQIIEFKLGLITKKVCECLADDKTYFDLVYGDKSLKLALEMDAYLYLLDHFNLEAETRRVAGKAKEGLIEAAEARGDVPKSNIYVQVEADKDDHSAMIEIIRQEQGIEEAA